MVAIESSIIFFLVSWSAWMILANQWQRRQFLAMELCRPIGRSDFLTDLFANLVKQFRLIPFIVVFVLVPSVLFRNPDFAAINQVLIYAVCALSLCVYWFGFGCNVLSMRNTWLIGIFSVVFLTMLVVCALSPYWYLEIFKRGQPAFPIVISSVFMSVSGIFMIMVSLRHWPNVELDPLRPQGY